MWKDSWGCTCVRNTGYLRNESVEAQKAKPVRVLDPDVGPVWKLRRFKYGIRRNPKERNESFEDHQESGDSV